MKYRCAGCRKYRQRPEYRRVGIVSVCCDECFRAYLTKDKLTIKGTKTTKIPNEVSPAVRAAVMKRDRSRCRFCGIRSDLHLHHITYRSESVDHSPHNLIVLCDKHHAHVHADKRYWQPLLRAYIWVIYVEGRQRWLRQLEQELYDRKSLEEQQWEN